MPSQDFKRSFGAHVIGADILDGYAHWGSRDHFILWGAKTDRKLDLVSQTFTPLLKMEDISAKIPEPPASDKTGTEMSGEK